MSDQIRFVLNRQERTLTRDQVEQRLDGLAPRTIQRHAVKVNGVWYPVRQAFEVATGATGEQFISHIARRHLQALGFELSGEVQPRTDSTEQSGSAGGGRTDGSRLDESWHTEANVQAAVIAWLTERGWQLVSSADTASREHGIDVVARRLETVPETVGIEVKGYPSRGYANPDRAGETKRTQPSAQAGHWYAAAVLAAMRLRSKHPSYGSVIALPDFPRYRNLYAETKGSLEASDIELWWVQPDGSVEHTER